jgi:hypothetical protein
MKAKANEKTAHEESAAKARTIVYIHGVGNKPVRAALKRQWDTALFGFELGERSRMAYWVNRDLHGPPEPDTDDSDDGSGGFSRLVGSSAESLKAKTSKNESSDMFPSRAHQKERDLLSSIARKMDIENATTDRRSDGLGARVLPLPRGAREWVTRRVTKRFLRDVYDFFFVPDRRDAMRRSLEEELRTATGPVVVISHSQGSMIAYDVLSRWDHEKFPVTIPLLVTIGSPLGIKEVQDQLKEMTGQTELSVPLGIGKWLNVADPLDPVALDGNLSSDFLGADTIIYDRRVINPKRPHAHSGIGYLSSFEVRKEVAISTEPSLFQRVSPSVVTRSIDRSLISGQPEDRHPVLIEVQDRPPSSAQVLLRDANQQSGRFSLVRNPHLVLGEAILTVVRELSSEFADRCKNNKELSQVIDLEILPSYVSARLTEREVRVLAARYQGRCLYRVFANAAKSIHVRRSIDTVQARTAHLGYNAVGINIDWAVLDTGVDWSHRHFKKHKNIASVWDCTGNGEPVHIELATNGNNDIAGHGTHVAGIIAGHYTERTGALGISGMAPNARLHCYKVLGDDGQGEDIKILKAIHHILETNRTAGTLLIKGVNLSLGGPFDFDSFGCGDTPLCKELRKLWRQGVVVVLSAGNKGVARGVGTDLEDITLSSSIEDPANLDESIVVGSVHSTMPKLYGVSYFSSRGPTADGRSKPDLVAPGENIQSCSAGARGSEIDRIYRFDSGTSMAAPHVSGLIAAFLSVRNEYIGYPDRVKKILLEHCTDLGRSRSHQGAGMANLVKMLMNT